jgi:hypothetical protein
LGIESLCEFVYRDGIWPPFAFSFCNALFCAAFVLGGAGSIWSIVVLSCGSLRRRVGAATPVFILCLSSLLAGVTAFREVTYQLAQGRPMRIEIEGPDLYSLDGVRTTRDEAERSLHMRWRKYGFNRPIHFRACPATVFSQVERILGPCWRINIGLVGAPDLLPAMFSHMPDDIFGPPVNVVDVYMSVTNCTRIHFDPDGSHLNSGSVAPSSFAHAFLPPTTNGLDYRVILHCSSNASFGDIFSVVQQCGAQGIEVVHFEDDYSLRSVKAQAKESPQTSTNKASDAPSELAPGPASSPHQG